MLKKLIKDTKKEATAAEPKFFFEFFSLWVAQLAANFQQLCELSELVKYLKKRDIEIDREADGQNYSLSVFGLNI